MTTKNKARKALVTRQRAQKLARELGEITPSPPQAAPPARMPSYADVAGGRTPPRTSPSLPAVVLQMQEDVFFTSGDNAPERAVSNSTSL